jgi:preprotein translocase subunit SecD
MTLFTEDDLRAALSDDARAAVTPADVWPRLRRRRARQQRLRAGLAIATAGAVGAGVFVGWPGHGETTRVPVAVSTAQTLVPDRPLSDAELQASIDILRHRLDSLGVQHTTISTDGDTVLVDASGTTNADIAAIAVRGVLQFRPVNSEQPGADGAVAYQLGPVALDNSDVASASTVQNTIDHSWLVQVEFNRAGAEKFRTLTADAARKPDAGICGPPQGCNAIAIVVDGAVISAPTVEQPGGIRGGQTEITGELTKEQAQTLAALAQAPPLPVAFTVG